MKNLKSIFFILSILILFTHCEKDVLNDSNNIEINHINKNLTPDINNKIEFTKITENNIEYFYTNKPNEIISISKGVKTLEKGVSNLLVSLASDLDNFGYGIGNSLPCSFYNLSDPIIDLGVFDKVDYSEAPLMWTQRFDQNEEFTEGSVAVSVLIEINEAYSDGQYSTLEIDGESYNFTVNGNSYCGQIVQTFYFTGDDASFANDGIINFVFTKNGDAISLDYCKVTVDYTPSNDFDNDGVLNENDAHPYSDMSEKINIGGCYPNADNKMVKNGSTMMDQINDLIAETNALYNGKNYDYLHKRFMTKLAGITYNWKTARLITATQRTKISSCAWGANIPNNMDR